MRIHPLFVLGALLCPSLAWPCTQYYALGEVRPREGEVYPSNGALWIDYSGPTEAVVGLIRGPDHMDTPFAFTRVDQNLLTAPLPPLTPGATYELELSTGVEEEPRRIHFVAGSSPETAAPDEPSWGASFNVLTDAPCANPGVYVSAEVFPSSRRVVAYRLFHWSRMAPLGSLIPHEPEEPPYLIHRWVAQFPACVALAAMGVDGTLTFSPQRHCFPPDVLDAGVIDAGHEPDAGQPADASAPDATAPDATAPDAGPPPDAGSPAPDAGQPDARGLDSGDLAAGEDGCGCTSTRSAGQSASAGLLLCALLAARRRRRLDGAPRPS